MKGYLRFSYTFKNYHPKCKKIKMQLHEQIGSCLMKSFRPGNLRQLKGVTTHFKFHSASPVIFYLQKTLMTLIILDCVN